MILTKAVPSPPVFWRVIFLFTWEPGSQVNGQIVGFVIKSESEDPIQHKLTKESVMTYSKSISKETKHYHNYFFMIHIFAGFFTWWMAHIETMKNPVVFWITVAIIFISILLFPAASLKMVLVGVRLYFISWYSCYWVTSFRSKSKTRTSSGNQRARSYPNPQKRSGINGHRSPCWIKNGS